MKYHDDEIIEIIYDDEISHHIKGERVNRGSVRINRQFKLIKGISRP